MIGRRLLMILPVLLIVSFLTYSLTALIPGDAAQTLAGGPDASPEAIEEVRAELHLDEPFFAQYGDWLGGVVQGDLGTSLYSGQSISDEIAERLPVTFSLALLALALALPFALLIGIRGGLHPGGIFDRSSLVGTSIAIAMPSFWVGLLLVSLFAVTLKWLPPFGYVPFTENPWEWFRHLLLPAVALGLVVSAVLSRQVRAGLSDTMDSAFVRTGWAKGGNTRQVVTGHALKTSAIPAVTVLGLQIGALLGGAVIIEQIFSLPGLGKYLLGAVQQQDIPVVLASALLLVVINMLASLAVDVTYGYLNPKVRTQ
jgi:peptide/nickel transport system permease protein